MRVLVTIFCLFNVSFARAEYHEKPMSKEQQTDLKNRMSMNTPISEKYLEVAEGLKYAPVEKGQKITGDECRAQATKLNKTLSHFWFKKRSSKDYKGTRVEGIDFCAEDELNVARQAFNPTFYWTDGDFKSATGLPARSALTLEYYGAKEQFLIDAQDRVVQYLNEKMEVGTVGDTTIALTPEGHVVYKQEHLYDGKPAGLEAGFGSADGTIDVTRNYWMLGNTEVVTATIGLAEVGSAKPLVSVLTTLFMNSIVQGVRMDGALNVTNRTWQDNQGPSRFWSIKVSKAQTKICEQGSYNEKEGEYFVFGNNDECLKEFAPKRRPINPLE